MATNSLQSLNYHHNSPTPFRRQSTHYPPSTFSLFLKPTTPSLSITHSLSSATTTTAFSLSSATPSTSQSTTPFDLLRHHLSTANFREADEETRRLLIVLAGDAAQKRGYVFFSEVQFISETDLKTIDELWKQHSDNKFGYSVQKKIWEKMNRDFTRLFIKVGWMKKLDTEVQQYNYRAFPNEFIWELNEDTQEGHLPLTNALRGTQLFNSILTHPAFEESDEEIDEERGISSTSTAFKALSKGSVLKPDYSF